MNTDHVAVHLAHLRGDVSEGETFFVNDQAVEATVDFNVYTEQNRFANELKALDKNILDKEEYTQWLTTQTFIKIITEPTERICLRYKTFPYCPGYRDVLKTIVILTSCVKMEQTTEFSIDDVYVQTVMKELIKTASFDASKDYATNLKNLTVSLREILQVKENEVFEMSSKDKSTSESDSQ